MKVSCKSTGKHNPSSKQCIKICLVHKTHNFGLLFANSPIIWRKTEVWNQSITADADWQKQCFIHYLIQTECRRNPNYLLLYKHNRTRTDWKLVYIRTNCNTLLLQRHAFWYTAGKEPSWELYHIGPTNFKIRELLSITEAWETPISYKKLFHAKNRITQVLQ